MVAETLSQPKPRKRQGFQARIPLPQKLQVRALYVIQQLSTREICEKTGLTDNQVRNLICREKWRTSKMRAKTFAQEKHDARIREGVEEFVESVAIQTEELSVGTLSKARTTLDREDVNAARDLQAYSQAAKNFVGIARQARGLDAEMNRERTNGTTVIFVGELARVGDAKRKELNVTPNGVENAQPAIEIQSAPTSPKLT